MVRRVCLAAALAMQCSAVFAADRVVTLGFGADYSTGDYGKSEETSVSALHVDAKYEAGRWTHRLSVPYLRIAGPANVVGLPSDAVVLPGEGEGRRRVSGWGDVVASSTYKAITHASAAVFVDLGAKVKLATADEDKGLGTGKNDYSVQADLFVPAGATTPFATAGYRWYGDPAGTELHNAFYGTLGVAHRDASGSTLGVMYDFRQRIVDGGDRTSEVIVFVSRPLGAEWRAQLYFVKGYSDASPGAGIGAVVGRAF